MNIQQVIKKIHKAHGDIRLQHVLQHCKIKNDNYYTYLLRTTGTTELDGSVGTTLWTTALSNLLN